MANYGSSSNHITVRPEDSLKITLQLPDYRDSAYVNPLYLNNPYPKLEPSDTEPRPTDSTSVSTPASTPLTTPHSYLSKPYDGELVEVDGTPVCELDACERGESLFEKKTVEQKDVDRRNDEKEENVGAVRKWSWLAACEKLGNRPMEG